MCCHYPVKSSAWQGGVSHHELITLRYSSEVTLKFWTLPVLKKARLIFCLFIFLFEGIIISTGGLQSIVSQFPICLPEGSNTLHTKINKRQMAVNRRRKTNENVHFYSPLNVKNGFRAFNFNSDNSGLPFRLLCTSILYSESYRCTGQARPAW